MKTPLPPIEHPPENPCRCGHDYCKTCNHIKAWWAVYHSENTGRASAERMKGAK